MNSIEVTGKTVDQAIEIGLYKLNAQKEDVKIIRKKYNLPLDKKSCFLQVVAKVFQI